MGKDKEAAGGTEKYWRAGAVKALYYSEQQAKAITVT